MLKDIADLKDQEILNIIPKQLFHQFEIWATHSIEEKSIERRGETMLGMINPDSGRNLISK